MILMAGRETGEDVFVRFSSIHGDRHRSLEEGKPVELVVVSGEKGPRAQGVTILQFGSW